MADLIRNVRVLTAPAYEPVTRAEAKRWCRIDDDITTHDAVIDLLIGAMRELAEDITGRALVLRTLELRLDDFPSDPSDVAFIELPYPPLQSVQYIQYTDAAGDDQTIEGEDLAAGWKVDTGSTPGRIQPASGESWPGSDGSIGNVRIGYTAGYAVVGSPGDETAHQAGIPKRVKQWMEAKISTSNEYREMVITGTIVQELPRDFVDGLLDGLRVNRMFA